MDFSKFDKVIDGSQVQLMHLQSDDISCYVTNYGARVVALIVQDADEQEVDIVLGFDSIDGYLTANEQYHGATVGRYANRIAHGSFAINGVSYKLETNNGPNSLHGGSRGFHNRVWSVVSRSRSSVEMSYVSKHMEEGFPGELTVTITYTLDGGGLIIKYLAASDEDTVVNLTHHSYFNLNGEGSGSILGHQLQINADSFTPVNEEVIPTGGLTQVASSPFDFKKFKLIGSDIDQKDDQLRIGSGYDHNYVVNSAIGDDLPYVATAIGDQSGVQMSVYSSEPGVQLYTANHLNGNDLGKNGLPHKRREAFCLETQHFPDSPNQDSFPSTLLRAGTSFQSQTEYRFSLK